MTIFYEPRNGHGLPHDPFNSIVGPRPIGWVSTKSASGILNLAPYSFFNAFNYIPPIVGFSSIGAKDSLRNVQEKTCAPVPPEVNEFELAGLTPQASNIVQVPRVLESPVAFECRCTQIVQLEGHDHHKVNSWLVLGEVVGIHIDERSLKDGIYDTANAQHVMRGGGPADYFSVGPEQLFRMSRPTA